MGKNVFDLSSKNFRFEIDVSMPLSKKADFLTSHRQKEWNNETSDVFEYFSSAMNMPRAMDFYKGLPDYCKITKVNVYPSSSPNATRFYSGPFMVPEDKAKIFFEKRADIIESKLNRLEKSKNELMKTKVPIYLLLKSMNTNCK